MEHSHWLETSIVLFIVLTHLGCTGRPLSRALFWSRCLPISDGLFEVISTGSISKRVNSQAMKNGQTARIRKSLCSLRFVF